MNLAAGTKLGPYEILAPIGSGAMGDVYKARDTRLDRDVAIKVLPPAFARDPDRLARFEREARAVAAINHPNILAVHDIGSADVIDSDEVTRATYMITELLDGDTLRARLAQGPLAARKCIDVGVQIASGLAAAHDRGIIHRDLKPENVVLLRDGHVKILDFGLAKQLGPDRTGSGDQPTMAATDAGTVLGTVGYMAPEQVRGEPADARSDLFALGAVLYELTSGHRAFARRTAAETMTAVLRDDPPDLAGTLTNVSPALDRIVRHALEKDPGDRFQSARDFAFALQALSNTGSAGDGSAVTTRTPARRPIRGRELAAWALAGLLAVAAGTATFWPRASSATTGSPIIFTASPPWSNAELGSPSVAPDGQRVALIAGGRGANTIVIRRLDSIDATPIKGTVGARAGSVFWSPDGRSIGFFASGKLKIVELTSGKVDEITDAPSAFGATWGPDGTILFSPDERAPIFRVNANGGTATAVTTLDPARRDQAHRWPQFLPDGRHFVFMPWNSGTTKRAIQLASLDGGPTTTLFESATGVIVAGTNFLYVREQPANLLAQAFDPGTLQLVGRAEPVAPDENVDFSWLTGDPFASASASALVYTTGKLRVSQLTWFNRTGQAVGKLGDPDVYYDPAISPDGTTMVIEKRASDIGTTDLWTVDLVRGAMSRLTSTPGFESVGTWASDSRRIAFGSDQQESAKIYVKHASGTGTEEAIVDRRAFPMDWSRDGRYLLYATDGGATKLDTWIYDADRRTSTPLLASPFNEVRAKFSPNGKWIAYVSDETGDRQVYVRSFADETRKIPVSLAGGNEPEWRRDGKELFYLAPDSTLMSVAVREDGAQLIVDAAQPLFQTNAEQERGIRNRYTASPDGLRFLVLSPLIDPHTSPLVAVLNWAAGLKR